MARDRDDDHQQKNGNSNFETALSSSYNEQIRPLLDAVDHLRRLRVMQEGIQLPTIVVVGDQSSGKSSVLESLAGISLPRGQGICTRVPLIMRLQSLPSISDKPQLHLEYKDKTMPISESTITDAINKATEEIAGDGKGISNTPLTLVIKKKGVPDLTMVDLPGITRVPVHGQPENIYEQISSIIMEYIAPKESIILNVLSATVDFPTCESIRMSQQVDKTGERTLAVVTKADKAPEGLFEKVAADDVNIGLGYVCVRNRIGDESHAQARIVEARLFEAHPLLSKIDKSIVGIPVLAHKLMLIQATSIGKCLPDIVRNINNKLRKNEADLDAMPEKLSTVADAIRAFMLILSNAKESLRKILIRGEFDGFGDDTEMHGTARLAEMLNKYSAELSSGCPVSDDRFLMEEIHVLEETKGIALPNFVSRPAFLAILQRKLKGVSDLPLDLVRKVWVYIETIVVKVLLMHSNNYPQLQSSTRRAAESLIDKMKSRSYLIVEEIVEMEMIADYTCNPEYMMTWSELMAEQACFMQAVCDCHRSTSLHLSGLGVVVDVGHLREYSSTGIVKEGYDIRMRLHSYWKCVVLRLVDGLALHILFSVKNLVEKELESEILRELVGPDMSGIELMLEESPSTAGKRDRLRKRIELLKESKEVVAKIIHRININASGD